jgi:D-glycero-D-manno-heptose 1,7-bisphosphate phosphatase
MKTTSHNLSDAAVTVKMLCCYHSGVADSANSFLPRALRTVFLDRDGVLNRKMPEGSYIASWSEFQPLPGVAQAIARLNRAGLRVVVASNQRGIALGLYTSDDVRKVHSALQSWLQSQGAHIDAFYFCPHDKRQCNCRKPLPGLFQQASADFPEIAAASSVMIGDSLSDIEFGQRLGMTTLFLDGTPGVPDERIGSLGWTPGVPDERIGSLGWTPELRKPGAQAARQLANLCFPSLPDATDALLAHLAPPNQTS